jgi:hypothetical protein
MPCASKKGKKGVAKAALGHKIAKMMVMKKG